jgi:hypothetical protein
MTAIRIYFLALCFLLVLVGLYAAASAHDYLGTFGLMLAAFGGLYGVSVIKSHFDEAERARHAAP